MTDRDHVWALIEDQPTCMFVTSPADDMPRARPMRAIVRTAHQDVLFYTRLESGKSAELREDGAVCLCFGCPEKAEYVSMSGAAALTQDRELIHDNWSRFVDAWFPEGPDGADVAMIRVTPTEAAFWDSESSHVLSALKMLTASARDKTPDMGVQGKVSFG